MALPLMANECFVQKAALLTLVSLGLLSELGEVDGIFVTHDG